MDIYVEEPNGKYKSYKDFTSLRCWKECREIKLFFYHEILPQLPKEEKHNIDFQIRKSSRSITANIAEGVGRYHYQEAIQFLRISRGSLYELKDDLISCGDLKYISEDLLKTGLEKIEKAKATLNGFINYNEKQKAEKNKKSK